MISLNLTDRFIQHMESIAARGNVTIDFSPMCDRQYGMASTEQRKILVGLPTQHEDPIIYATGLHELGHILSSLQPVVMKSDIQAVLGIVLPEERDAEIDAWRWAKDHALIWTDEMQKFTIHCLGTYGIRGVQI